MIPKFNKLAFAMFEEMIEDGSLIFWKDGFYFKKEKYMICYCRYGKLVRQFINADFQFNGSPMLGGQYIFIKDLQDITLKGKIDREIDMEKALRESDDNFIILVKNDNFVFSTSAAELYKIFTVKNPYESHKDMYDSINHLDLSEIMKNLMMNFQTQRGDLQTKMKNITLSVEISYKTKWSSYGDLQKSNHTYNLLTLFGDDKDIRFETSKEKGYIDANSDEAYDFHENNGAYYEMLRKSPQDALKSYMDCLDLFGGSHLNQLVIGYALDDN
jgi:hypothetical protein